MLRPRREDIVRNFQAARGANGRLEYAPAADTVDTNEKILNLAAEITGKPADLKTITGDKKPAGQKADTFDPAAYQLAKRLAKQPIPGGKPARFDPQIPVS